MPRQIPQWYKCWCQLPITQRRRSSRARCLARNYSASILSPTNSPSSNSNLPRIAIADPTQRHYSPHQRKSLGIHPGEKPRAGDFSRGETARSIARPSFFRAAARRNRQFCSSSVSAHLRAARTSPLPGGGSVSFTFGCVLTLRARVWNNQRR